MNNEHQHTVLETIPVLKYYDGYQAGKPDQAKHDFYGYRIVKPKVDNRIIFWNSYIYVYNRYNICLISDLEGTDGIYKYFCFGEIQKYLTEEEKQILNPYAEILLSLEYYNHR